MIILIIIWVCAALLIGRSQDRFPVVSLGIFSVVPPTEPCALRSTQPLKVSTRDFSWGKGGRCLWLTTYHPCSAEMSRKSGALNYRESLGPPRPVAGDIYFTFNNNDNNDNDDDDDDNNNMTIIINSRSMICVRCVVVTTLHQGD